MKVVFYCSMDESDVYEFPDDISEEELTDMACEWVADNVEGYWEEVDE